MERRIPRNARPARPQSWQMGEVASLSRFTWIMNRPCFRNRQSYVTIFLMLERKYRFDASGSEVAHGSALVQSDVQFVLLRLTQLTFRPRKVNYHQTFIDARFRCACLKSDAPWRETNSSLYNRREGVGVWESAGPCVWSHWRFRDIRWRDVKHLIHGPPWKPSSERNFRRTTDGARNSAMGNRS